jgi:MOSC domain-containing protein YiiM
MSSDSTNGFVSAVCISGVSGLPRPSVQVAELREGLGFVDNKHSVGGDREVCLFEEETYAALREEGSVVQAGCLGENLVLSGIPFANLKQGDRLRVGENAELEITIVRLPCKNLTQIDANFPEALIGRSGWMAKVVRGGNVKAGDTVVRG